jgi:RND family efflux transporter MFP subunit
LKNRMSIWKQALVSLAVVAVAGVLWVRFFPEAAAVLESAGIATASVATGEGGGPGPEAPRGSAPVVLGAPVTEATINASVSAIGDGRAARSVTITPYVSGRVAAIEIGSGEFVTAGTALVRLDAEAEEIALARARLVAADAVAAVARSRELRRTGAVNEVTLLQSELAAEQARLAVRDAELALERRVIRAPFDGWIGILGVDIGDQVTTTTEVATIDDRSRILVDFRIPERFVGQVTVGAPVTARALALVGGPITGEVVTLDSRVSPDTRTLRVRASFDNADDMLRAGMSFSISLRFPGDTLAAVDPLAVQWSADGAYVWVAEEGLAKQVPVRIVQRNNDAVLVDAALEPGTMVVTQGVQLLRPGLPFSFEGAAPAAAAGAPAPARPARG